MNLIYIQVSWQMVYRKAAQVKYTGHLKSLGTQRVKHSLELSRHRIDICTYSYSNLIILLVIQDILWH